MKVLDPPPKQPEMQESQNWRISSRAIDLLQSFKSGIDDIILKVAFEHAQIKSPSAKSAELRIDTEDIETAARTVLDELRSQSGSSETSKAEIAKMDEWLKARCRKMKMQK